MSLMGHDQRKFFFIKLPYLGSPKTERAVGGNKIPWAKCFRNSLNSN